MPARGRSGPALGCLAVSLASALLFLTSLGASFDIRPARMFLPGAGGCYFCRLRRASLLLHPAQLRLVGALCSCLRWKALFRPVVFTCTLCVALVESLVSRVGPSLAPSFFVPGGWVDLSSCYVQNSLIVGFCDSSLRLRFCSAFRIHLRSSCGYRLLVRSRLRGVFGHELLFHISLLGLRALFLTVPPFRLRSPSLCDLDV